jgi:hypothetical protein
MLLAKIQVDPIWHRDVRTGALCFYKGGFIEESELLEAREPNIVIPWRAYNSLVQYIEKSERGVLRTDRDEDVKIIHELIDIIKKMAGNSS